MKTILSAALAVTLALSAMEAGAQDKTADRKVELAIEQQSLADALNEWAKQTGLQLVSSSSEMMNTTVAPLIKGEYTPKGALEELLKGTSLTYEWVGERAVAIREKSPVVPAVLETTGARERVEVPRLQVAKLAAEDERRGGAEGARAQGSRSSGPEVQKEDVEELEEVVVTGTHIRGESLNPGHVIVIDRSEIEASGYSDVGQLAASLPQNFGGGASQTTGNLGRNNAGLNSGLGTGINLRGLGNSATLVLLNGNRLSPGGEGSFVDVSLIPLSAIERIEVLTDGASAVYGADAIGGVVNIITRRNYDGAESRARVAATTPGGRNEYSLAQLLGHSWDSGNITANFEHTQQDELRSADRSFAIPDDGPYDLMPSQRWDSLMTGLRLEVAPRLSLRADLLATDRHYDFKYFRLNDPPQNKGSVLGAGMATALELDVGDTWQIGVVGNYSRNRQRSQITDPLTPGVETKLTNTYNTWSAELKGSGELLSLPAGPLRVALGAVNRHEGIDANGSGGGGYSDDRTIRSAYAELSVPILGDEQSTATQLLKVSLAGRLDDYSDLGSTTNPRLAIMWRITGGLVARAAYSESFRAPLFSQTLATPELYSAIAYDVPDPSSSRPDGSSTAIVLDGPNAALSPETARSWTAGIEYHGERGSSNAVVALNYFDIAFKNRILAANSVDPLGFLTNESYFRGFITRNPSDDLLLSVLSPLVPRVNDFNTFQFGITDIPAFLAQNNFAALFDGRLQNAAESDLRGIDASFNLDLPTTKGTFAVGMNASYILDYSSRFTQSAPSLSTVNTVFNPIDLRLRASASWAAGPWAVDAFVNYVDAYDDPGGAYTTGGDISSWTTLDLQLRLILEGNSNSPLDGITAAISASNVFDKRPPTLQAQPGQLAFDPENASPLGRFIALTLSKRW